MIALSYLAGVTNNKSEQDMITLSYHICLSCPPKEPYIVTVKNKFKYPFKIEKLK